MCRHSGYPLSLLLSKPLSSEPFQPLSFVQICTKHAPHWPLTLTSCVCSAFRWAWWRGCCYPSTRNTRPLPENMKQVIMYICFYIFRDRHVTVVCDEGKAPVLVREDLRELIGRIRNREDREELLVDVTEFCQMIWFHLLQPYPSHGLSKAKIDFSIKVFAQ